MLATLLADGVRYAPNYLPSGNSDHLPMALAAMSGLGGTDEQLQAFRDVYRQRLHELPASDPLQNWRDGIGRRDRHDALRQGIRLQINEQGRDQMLATLLPELLPSLVLDAFHPVIRLGYAVEFDHDDEVAAALAYWVAVHRQMPVGETELELGRAVDQQSAAGLTSPVEGRFSESILSLVEAGEYPLGCASGFEEIASVALDLYQATRNFFALHLVTATQALRCATPPALRSLALAAMTGALLASHRVLGSPARGENRAAPGSLDPEHAYKFCWSCLSEYTAYGDPRYLDEVRGFRKAGLVPAWAAASVLGDAN